MKRYILWAGAAALVVALGGWVLITPLSTLVRASTDSPGGTETADLAAGAVLYQQDCASCHGDNLQGQPNWRTPDENGQLPAPPHDLSGHTWHHGDGLLFLYTKLGGKEMLARQGVAFDSAMPGFGDQLSDRQIRDILAYIKSTWPDEQQEFQAKRSEAERLQEEANQ